ncbi:DNA polymerase III, delta subunit [Persephonella hydrogeniphila]|uniref:DNA-directed DNA polymerase n=1 Tax=Persephonella hydrogeniphila TaxID=198703 RepID=A0A285NR52_9AQUI|nr:DNA polymerase III subunit delta [Persephonella hydrogeniphila]SNZ10101.1 DNA polymerase III, delta subunit [Persephonella hydrogeniphila]
MAEKSIIQLIKNFDIQTLKPVVFVYGNEEFLKKQLVDKLKEKEDIHLFWGDETSYNQIKELFSNPSLFSEGNTAVLLDFESFYQRQTKEDQKEFIKLIESVHIPDRFFIISKKEKIPVKEPYKTFKNIADKVVSQRLTPKAFMVSIKKKIEKSGKEIDDDTLKYLSSMLSNDLWYAKQEIEKLLTYLNDKRKVTKEDIDRVVTPKISENVFVFLDKFFAGEAEAVRLLKELTETTHHPFEIQSLLLNQINRLLLFRTLIEKGKSVDFAFEKMHIKHPAVKGSIQKQASRLSKDELIQLIKELYVLEKKQKVQYEDIYKSLEQFVIKRVIK